LGKIIFGGGAVWRAMPVSAAEITSPAKQAILPILQLAKFCSAKMLTRQ
jgi:hypothetical protein